MTRFAAAVVEAWQELRIHKLRVLLSLIGVGVAVCSLTTAVAVANVAQQAMVEQYEKQDGRPAYFGIWAYSESDAPTDAGALRRAVDETMETYGITYYSSVAETATTGVIGGRRDDLVLRVVDPSYAVMHRLVPTSGRWLTAQDAQNYSPTIVADARLLKALGVQADDLPATMTLNADVDVTATIVGAVEKDSYSGMPTAYMLTDTYTRWFGAGEPTFDSSYQMWVPLDIADELGEAVQASLGSRLPGTSLEVYRQDYLSWGDGDPLGPFKYVVGGVSLLILLLGVLSLLNIALVTIKQRVREIGIRRSFGATSGRVFFSVMMESVVGTFVAGFVGVVAAVGIVNSPLARKYLMDGVEDVPGFPVSAAVAGLLVSLAVGALAGLLPALVAVRVRIIDAIRF